MNKKSQRSGRLRDFLLREISELVRQKVRDPRVGNITITDVDVSPDGSFARVFFTRMGEDEGQSEIEDVLNKAQGFFRSHIAQSLNMRVAPNIVFQYDGSFEESDRISRLLSEALNKS